ncbi:MAG: hypothetical protein Kow0031_04160 [Anaerolineae bacterium]
MTNTTGSEDKRLLQLEVLQQVNALISSDEPTEAILQAILEVLVTRLGYSAAQIYQLTATEKDLWLYLETGHGRKPVTQTIDIFSVDEINIISDAVRQRKPVLIADVSSGPYSYFAGDEDEISGAEAALPLRFGSTNLGVLRVQHPEAHGISPADLANLEGLARLVATTIRNNRTIERLQDSIQEIKTLYTVQYQNRLEQQQRAATHRPALGFEYNGEEVAPTRSSPLPPDELPAITTRQQNGHHTLLVPINLHNETIGVLGLEALADATAGWGDEDINLLEEVSSQVSLAIENARLLQQTREQTNELTILFEATRQLTETIELQEIYEILTSQVINYLDADRASVLLLNEARTHFEAALCRVRHKDRLHTTGEARSLAVDSIQPLQQLIKQPSLLILQAGTPNLPLKVRQYLNRDGAKVQTLTIFPLIVRNNLVGILELEHLRGPHFYAQKELQLAQAIVAQVTVAIENGLLFRQTQQSLKDTEKLYDISRQMVESTSVEDVFNIILNTVKSYNIDRVSISLIDRQVHGEIESVAIAASWDRDPARRLPIGTRFPSSSFSLVRSFARPPFKPLISHNLHHPEQDERMDPAFRQYAVNKLGVFTLFSTPMFLGTEYKGVLSIYTRTPHYYTDREISIYQTLADQAIIAIENYRLLEATRQERDRASLLYELSQSLSQMTTVEQVQEAILEVIPAVGALDGELFITDGADFGSMASTIARRQNISPQKLVSFLLGDSHEAQALHGHEPLVVTRGDVPPEMWPLQNIPGMGHIQTLVSVPFFSQRSTLQGVLSLFHSEPDAFSADQIATFEAVAIQTATTLENVWLLRHTNMVLLDTELLYNVTRGFNSAQSINDILRAMADNMPDSNVDGMLLGMVSGLDGAGKPRFHTSPFIWRKDTDEISRAELELNRNTFSFIDRLRPDSHLEIQCDDFAGDTRRTLGLAGGGDCSVLTVPLTVGKDWLGQIMLVSASENHHFDTSTISQLTTIAGQAAIVIKNINLVENTQKNLRHSEILSTLGRKLLAAENTGDIYQLALEAIAATTPARGAAIFTAGPVETGAEFELAAMWNNPAANWPAPNLGASLAPGALGVPALLQAGEALVSANGQTDPRCPAALQRLVTELQIQSLVMAPVWLQKKVAGFILVGHNHTGGFAGELVRLYEEIARETSGALENRRLFDEAAHRAWQLQIAAEISQAATASLDLDALLTNSVELIKERFDYYHASIFLLDDYRHYAVVRASTGEIGRQMLENRHRLEVGGRSIVGTATATGKPKIALDVGEDAVHFNNPLLPDTRSEMALPLIAQGRVIGALDVQSTKRGAFTEGDITVLQSMANQLANAIEAAQAYQESRQALAEVSKLHQRAITEQYSVYRAEQATADGYELLDGERLVPIRFDTAGQPDRPATGKPNGNRPSPETLEAPLVLHGQAAIGSLSLELAEPQQNPAWDEDLREIVSAVSEQAAQAIEAARLFEQSQVAREAAEALYQVGRSLVTIESETEMFYTVLGKMLATLGLGQGGVLLINSDRQLGTLHALYRDGQPVYNPNLQFPVANNDSYQKLIATKQPVVIEDMATDPLVARVREMGLVGNTTSLLLVPIVINDEVVGAIGADSVGHRHQFTEREQNLAMAMADQLSIALQNRRLIEETSHRASLLQTSSDVGRAATSILDEDILVDQTIELIREGYGFDSVQIYMLDSADAAHLVPHKYIELGLTERIPVGSQTVLGQATHMREPKVAHYQLKQPGYQPSEATMPGVQSELAMPLHVGNTLLGALNVQSTQPNAFSDEEIATLETLSAQLAVAIQNARTFREQQETAERLKEIDKLKTQFLANMSHELRTPLNSIIGFSRVILKGIDGPLTELQKADLTSIYNSGQHLLGLINNILDLSKIEAGKMELNFEETDLEPVIKTVMSTAIALVKDKPVELVQHVPANLPTIWADPTRVRQVILNLVSNAAKFTDEGEISVTAATEPGFVVLSVADTGIGIPEEKIEHIFEEFTQVDGSTTRKVGGTGLGLPISRHFVEMHRGQIWVESRLGYGATFYVKLPTAPPESAGAPALPAGATPSPGGDNRVIVAVDDDPAVLNLYRRYLEKQNFQVVGVTRGKDALAVVKQQAPHAVLLDIVIPDKDGWSLIKELKEDPFTRNIPVIICSIVSDKNRGFSLGASNYLIKPIVEDDLVSAVRQLNSNEQEQVKVLVVDDHADDILLLRRILEAHPNYVIFEAANGREGLEQIRANAPDLIILDLNMPEMDGFELIETLKSNDATRDIPIIIVSGEEVTGDDHQKLTGQVEVLLQKSIFTEEQLLQDVSRALRQIRPAEKSSVESAL